jgi:hypothetical protein
MREPMLDELLEEPIIRKVMLADGCSADEIRLLIKQARVRAAHPSRPEARVFAGWAELGCCSGRAASSLQPS